MHSLPDPGPDDEATTPGGFLFGEDEPRRQDLPERELMERLTAMLRSCEGCENVTVTQVDRLDIVDRRDGCNWSLSIVLDPAGVAPEVYGLAYASVINTARASWNLK
jgi:hypothetical protein